MDQSTAARGRGDAVLPELTVDPAPVRVCVDRGGTFTDVVVLFSDGTFDIRKVPSDRAVVGQLCAGATELTFGTTVATNALLERQGVATVLFVSRGFADLAWIGDQARPSLFDSEQRWPAPLCRHVREVAGRLDVEGNEIEPLADGPVDLPADAEAVAIALLHSPRNPLHERRLADGVAAAAPHVFRALGHEVSPELGYLARIETTLVDAAITPLLRAALERDRIPADARVMRSDGSLCASSELRAPDAVLSGPAGGVLAVARIAEQAGFRSAVGLDMGGTSTDVCRVDVGRLPRREGEHRVAGVRLRRPILEVETIAAGGGSILTCDGLRLRVGPESAGAEPGPQCYGRGGPPTLTDAALAEGLVDPQAFEPPLRAQLVSLPGEAVEFLEIARESMAQAVRRLATARGIELSDHALIAYGGAAGQHAAHVAERLEIGTVLCHPCAGGLSAWGQALARREETAVAPTWCELPAGWEAVRAAWKSLLTKLPELGETTLSAELRHRGTDHAIEIVVSQAGGVESLLADFVAAHRQRFGFDRPEVPVEAVNARVRVRADEPTLPATSELAGDPWGIGDAVVRGPRLITTPTTAIHVPAGWRARRRSGLLWLERERVGAPELPTERTPYAVELWSNRFQAVAEEAGEVLRRLARSVNIRERRDFSCAIFDGRGDLVANAPHIPVHLGAMGQTVRDLIEHRQGELAAGQCYLSNDPAAGGSHLPDLTVITPVETAGSRWFVASRAHHIDVGGITPGSLPPRSRTLSEEGFVVRRQPLMENGRLRLLDDLLTGCREPEVVRLDLEAQLAANAHAARSLVGLGPAQLIDTWMGHLADVAEEAVAAVLPRLRPAEADDTLDGLPLRVALRPRREASGWSLEVDFAGTAGPHSGNLNAPRAVVRAAVLYALRVLVGRSIPLNDGSMRRVRLLRPARSLLSPPLDAAVAGGNVETSQRIVDLLLLAAGARAASQGTMNNLTLGGPDWSYYETIGGGLGASPAGPGASGRQVHMTNTRATDPEILEARLPLRVCRFALRGGSGGAGRHAGGDGLVRELELTAAASAALLASRRTTGAPGMAGGRPGLPGRDELRIDGRWRSWDGKPIRLSAGDRIRVSTPGGGGWGEPA